MLRQRYPPSASLSGLGEGGKRGVLPKRLKPGFGNHRLERCGPSNGRHKIEFDCPDFFPMFRYLARAINDALDTLNEPNAVFSQFLRSASMTIFFIFLSSAFLASSSCLVFSCVSCLSLSFPFLFRVFICFVSLSSLFFPFPYLLFFSLFLFSN